MLLSRRHACLTWFLLGLACSIQADEAADQEDGVTVLTVANWDEKVTASKFSLVWF